MHTVEIVLLVLLLGALTGIAARYVRAIPLPPVAKHQGATVMAPPRLLELTVSDLYTVELPRCE